MDDKSADEIIYVFLTLATPFAIKYTIDAIRKRKMPKPPKVPLAPNPASYWDWPSRIFLLSAVAWYFYNLRTPPFSFLHELGVEVNSPSFQVRNHFRDYMTERFPGWTLVPLSDSPSANLFDSDTYSGKIRPLEELYDKLRAGKWRRLYGRFGHDAIVNCNWCQDEIDFSIYGIGQIGTMTPRKNSWRSWVFGMLSTPAIIDIFCYSASATEMTALMSKETLRSLFATLHMIRNCVFMVSLLLVVVRDKSRAYSEAEALVELTKQASTNFSRISSLRLARAAIFSDSSLRDDFFKFTHSKTPLLEEEEMQRYIDDIPENLRNKLAGESEHFSREAILNAISLDALKKFS